MLTQKRFGRKISLPSTMEIKRDLIAMTHADTLVDDFKKQGGGREHFSEMIANSVENNLLTASRAQILTKRFQRDSTPAASAKPTEIDATKLGAE